MLNNRMLTIAVVLLLLLNGGILGYLLLSRGPWPGSAHRLLEKELHLSENQIITFSEMHRNHHKAMDSLNVQYARTLEAYFAQIGQSTVNKQVVDSLEASLSTITTGKARITFDHFLAFKVILTPEQAARFQTLLPQVMHVMQPQHPSGPWPRK